MLMLIILGLFILALPYIFWLSHKDKRDLNITVSDKNNTYSLNQYVLLKKQPIQLSLVVPSYNEEKRLPKMLNTTIDFLNQSQISFEIIVVNDSSKDKTTEVAKKFFTHKGKDVNLKIVEYPINKGKGGAVRTGMLISEGDNCLMVDADGATDINCLVNILEKMKYLQNDGHGIVAGSRNHIFSQVKRNFIRQFLANISVFIINKICGVKLKDTQCGFKLFSNKTAKKLFNILHLERWAFDVELFILANELDIPVLEEPVVWEDVDGSHLNVIEASFTMARDFMLVRILYILGLWKSSDKCVLFE